MAQEIKPNSTVERGFVDTGSLPQTPYTSLIRALSGASADAMNYLEQSIEKERVDIAKKLESPLLTAPEIDEIEKSAKFPVSRLLAKNRRGQFLAEQERATIEDDLANAPDVVAARERLIAHQARVLENVTDAGVAAGVREHFAAIGAPLLGEAAKRREILRDLGERADVNGTIAAAAKKDGDYLANIIVGAVGEETLARPDNVSQLHSDASTAIANRYAENPDTADELIKAIQTLTSTPGVFALESDKNKYLRVQDVIQTEERKRSAGALTEKALTARERAAKHQVYVWVRDNPRGTPLPPDLFQTLIENSKDPKAAEKWLFDLQAQQGKAGVVDSPYYKRALSSLKAGIPIDIATGAKDPVAAERRVSVFNRLAAAVDPAVLEDPQTAEATMSELASRAEQLASKEDELLKRTKEQRELVLREQAVSGRAAMQAGDVERAAKIARRIEQFKANPENRILQREIVRSDLYRYAESLGIDIQDDLIDLFP